MTAPVHDKVALTVVRFLGCIALTALAGVIFLVWRATESPNEIDPSTVALVAGVSTLAGSALGALGSILASTGKGAPQPVVVENKPSDPIPTQDATAGTNPVVTVHADAPEGSDL